MRCRQAGRRRIKYPAILYAAHAHGLERRSNITYLVSLPIEWEGGRLSLVFLEEGEPSLIFLIDQDGGWHDQTTDGWR
jgi:hypothetical protein